MAEDEIKDVAGFYKWLERCKAEFAALGEKWTTGKHEFAESWWNIHERRENKDASIPPDVDERRKTNDSLHRIEEDLKQIKKDTKGIRGFFKKWLSYGASKAMDDD